MGREEWGYGEGVMYLEVVAFVFVRRKVDAGEGDVVGEGCGVMIDVVSIREHFLFEFFAPFVIGFDCFLVELNNAVFSDF